MYADRVYETTASTGTGNLTLAGAPAGYRTFLSAFSAGSSCYYCVTSGTDWEVGAGVINAGSILSRSTVHSSSNSNLLVNFGSGTKNVYCVIPSLAMAGVLRDGSGPVFKSGGNSTTTKFQVSDGTDLAALFNFGFKTAEANRNAGASGAGAGVYKTYTIEQGSGTDKVRLAEGTVSFAIGFCSYCTYCTFCSNCSYCTYCTACSYCSYCSYCTYCAANCACSTDN